MKFKIPKKSSPKNLLQAPEELNRKERRKWKRKIIRELPAIFKYLKHLSEKRDSRNFKYPAGYCLSLLVVGLLCGVKDCTNIQKFLEENWTELRVLLPEDYGVPSHDVFCRVLQVVQPEELRTILKNWLESFYKPKAEKRHLAMDGTLPRASRPKSRANRNYLVELYDVDAQLTLDMNEVAEKSNEMKACLDLIKDKDLNGTVITTDAFNTTNDLMSLIVKKGGDYVLPVKKNRKDNYYEIKELIELLDKDQKDEEKKAQSYKDLGYSYEPKQVLDRHTTIEKNGNRRERRSCYYTQELEGLELTHTTGVKSVARIDRETETLNTFGDVIQTQKETVFILCSFYSSAEEVLTFNRNHWGIETPLHWKKDRYLDEDRSTNRKGNARLNFGIIRRICLNILAVCEALIEGIENTSTTNEKCIIFSSNLYVPIQLVFGFHPDWAELMSDYYLRKAEAFRKNKHKKKIPKPLQWPRNPES